MCKGCAQRTRDDMAASISKRPDPAEDEKDKGGRGGGKQQDKGGGGRGKQKAKGGGGGGRGKKGAKKGAGKSAKSTSGSASKRAPKPLPPPMCPAGWRCDQCQQEDSARDHGPSDKQMADL